MTKRTLTPADAIDHLLDALRIRIGSRSDAWLNNWSLIGRRLSDYLKTNEGYYGRLFVEQGGR